MERAPGCILTCDNGIAAEEAVETAKSLGMNVVITDHHEVLRLPPGGCGDRPQTGRL